MRSSITATIVLALLACVILAGCGRDDLSADSDTKTIDDESYIGKLVEQHENNGYTVRIHEKPAPTGNVFTLSLYHGEEKLHVMRSDRSFYLGNITTPEGGHEMALGADLNADGKADMVVTSYVGGTTSKLVTYVYELEPTLRLISKIRGDNGNIRIADVDGDGKYEIVAEDWTFVNLNASFAESSAVEVIFEWDGASYKPSPRLMRKELEKSNGEIDRVLSEVKEKWHEDTGKECPHIIWSTMLRLIYAGKSEEAYDFLDSAWPEGKIGKRQFIKGFHAKLARSPYYRAMAIGD